MIPRERLPVLLWVVMTVAVAFALFAIVLFGPAARLLNNYRAAQIVVSWCAFCLTLWAAAKVLLFFAIPIRIRLIWMVTGFVMGLTTTLTAGSWLTFSAAFYIPKFAAGTISAGQATVLSVVAVVMGLPTLLILIWQHPAYGEGTGA